MNGLIAGNELQCPHPHVSSSEGIQKALDKMKMDRIESNQYVYRVWARCHSVIIEQLMIPPLSDIITGYLQPPQLETVELSKLNYWHCFIDATTRNMTKPVEKGQELSTG